MAEKKEKSWLRKTKALIHKIKRTRINQKLLIYIIMVAVATAAWTINKVGSTISTAGTCEVEYYGLPKNRIIVPGITTSEIRINFSARGTQLLGKHGKLPVIRIDLSKLDIRTFPDSDSTLKFVTNDDIRAQVEQQMPTGFHFESLSPDTILIDLGASAKKKVPVVLQHKITFAKQYRLAGQPDLYPDSVIINGSEMIMDTVNCIYTEPLVVSSLKDSISRSRVQLIMPKGITCPLKRADVTIHTEKFTEGSVSVNIRQLNVPDNVALRLFKQKGTIKYHIGWKNYQKVSEDMFSLTVDYNEMCEINRAKYLPIHLTPQYPDALGITNITISPDMVECLPESIDTTSTNHIK